MAYDPFARGPHPVGVRTLYTTDPARDGRPLSIEIWYPAVAAHAGQDVDPATCDRYELLPVFPPVAQEAVREATPAAGPMPLVLFSHGFGSHRRQSTFFCTHLASHGYAVASVDHTGNTIHDMLQTTIHVRRGGTPPDGETILRENVHHRPLDVAFMIERVLADGGLPLDATRLGMSGHSFGGWTTLMVARREARLVATVPLAPAGGRTPLGGAVLSDALAFDWNRSVATLVLAAARDTLLPLDGMRELFGRLPAPKRLVLLEEADHMHFCDRAESVHEMFRMTPPAGAFAKVAKTTPPFSALCPADHAYTVVRGVGLAHFDAHVRRDEAAAAWVGGEGWAAHVRSRGIRVQG